MSSSTQGSGSNGASWNANEIRNNAMSWSLEGDAQLLSFMKSISKKLEQRSNRTTSNLHKMQLELDKTRIALGNTTNKLMALQHSQFVENRVYDEDETLANTENVPTHSTNQESQKMHIAEALEYALDSGLKMMDKYYEKTTFDLSDSDDDEGDGGHKSVVFQAIDPYLNRPLPYLIGSKEWNEKWHIGLVDSDEEGDELDREDVDEMSESSSSSSSSSSSLASFPSNAPLSMSESENSTWGVRTTIAQSLPKRGNQDIFENSSDEDNNVQSVQKVQATNVIKTNVPIHKVDDISSMVADTEKRTQPISTANTIFRPQRQDLPQVNANLFDSEPPELDSVPEPASRKPINLFLDDEDDDDFIFASSNTDAKNQPKSQPVPSSSANKEKTVKPNTIKSINLFADDDSDEDAALFQSATSTQKSSQPDAEPKSMFDDNEDEDIFKRKNPAPKSILSNKPAFFQNLFDDEPPEDDFDVFIGKPKAKSVEKVAVAPSDSVDDVKPDEIVKEVKNPEINPNSNSVPIVATASSAPTPVISKTLNLFDDGDDEDEFEALIRSSSQKKSKDEVKEKQTVKIEQPAFTNELSDKDESPSSEAKSTVKAISSETPKPSTSGALNYTSIRLFDDLPPDDDEFDTIVSKPKPASSGKKKQASEFYNDFNETITSIEGAAAANKSYSSSSFLFNDEPPDDEDIFTKPNALQNKSQNSAADVDRQVSKKVDIFENVKKQSETVNIKKKADEKQPKKLNIGNFDINVAALLPGAKRASSVSKEERAKDSATTETDAPADTLAFESSDLKPHSTPKQTTLDKVDSGGRLRSLNRDRVKAQPRRPSTRRGRQEQYQKSVDFEKSIESEHFVEESSETDAIFSEKSSINNNSVVISDAIVKPEATTQSVEVEKLLEADANKTNNNTNDVAGKTTSVSFSDEENTEIFTSNNEPTVVPPVDRQEIKTESAVEKTSALSFLDINENEDQNDDWLADVIADKSFTQTISESKSIASSLFSSEKENSWYCMPSEEPPELEKSPATERSFGFSAKSTGLFADESSDDDIFGGKSSDLPPSAPLKIPSLHDDLFNDNESDNWSPPLQAKEPSVQESASNESNDSPKKSIASPSIATALFADDDKCDIEEDFITARTSSKIPANKRTEKPVVKSASLFGEDSDDNDDLFGKPPPLPEVKKKTPIASISPAATKSKSLFDDDTSDDDLFGSSGVKTKTKSTGASSDDNKRSVIDTKSKTSVLDKKRQSGKLFSDSEDDDDDLFATKSKGAERKQSSVSSVPSKVTTSTKLVDDDPLADLMK